MRVDATYVNNDAQNDDDMSTEDGHEIVLSDLSDLEEDEGNVSDEAFSVHSDESEGPVVHLPEEEETDETEEVPTLSY